MINRILGVALVLLLSSCNDKLWDELDRVEQINQAQADRLKELNDEILLLQDVIDVLTDNVAIHVSEINARIDSNDVDILNITEELSDHSDSLQIVFDDVKDLELYAVESVEELTGSINGLSVSIEETKNDVKEIEESSEAQDDVIIGLLDAAVADLETAIAAIEIYHITNITEVTELTEVTNITEDNYDDTQIQSDLRELFCDAEEYFGIYVLPEYNNSSRWIGIYTDNTKEVLIDSIKRAQWGEYPNWTFRHFDENGWVGVFGENYNEAELPEYDYTNTYQESLGGELSTEHIYPDLGNILKFGVEVDNEIAFEFDEESGEYGGCATDYVVWYVNGVEFDKGANAKFYVGDLKGDYIVTAIFNDGTAAQHLVTKTSSQSAKAVVKKKGKTKARKRIIT